MWRRSGPFTGMMLAILFTISGDLRAQSRDPATAEALFRDGRSAVKRGDFETACPKFAESFRLDPAAGTLLNLARCEEERGRLATAWQTYRQLVDQYPTDDRAKIATKRSAALGARLPKVLIRLASDAPEGTEVLRDKVILGQASLDTALPVDPGDHEIVVRAPGREERRFPFRATEGKTKTIEVDVGDAEEEGVPVEPGGGEQVQPTAQPPILGYVIGGIGVAGLIGAGITEAMLASKNSTIEDECPNKQCTPAGIDAVDSAKTLTTVDTILWGVGLVGVGLGAYLILSGGDAPREGSAQVGAMVLPSGGAASVSGRF